MRIIFIHLTFCRAVKTQHNSLFVNFLFQNTEESFNYAYQTFRKFQSKKFKFSSKALSFLAALALKQQRHGVVLDVVKQGCEEKNVIVIKNILLETFVQINRLKRVKTALSLSLQNFPNKKKERFYRDVVSNFLTFNA